MPNYTEIILLPGLYERHSDDRSSVAEFWRRLREFRTVYDDPDLVAIHESALKGFTPAYVGIFRWLRTSDLLRIFNETSWSDSDTVILVLEESRHDNFTLYRQGAIVL